MKSEDLLIIENLVCRPKSDYLQHTITTEDRSEGHLFWKREWKRYEVRITWRDGGYAALDYPTCPKHPRSNHGQGHPSWKGGDAGYFSIHQWFTKQYGRPNPCEHCEDRGHEEKDGRWSIQWAKKRDCGYTRDVKDYLKLCRSCHRKYDMTENEMNRLKLLAENQTPEQRKKLSEVRKINVLKRKRDEHGHFIKFMASTCKI